MKSANIYIQGVIGENTTLIDVIRQVESQKDADVYNVYITSPGGLIEEGFDIYNYLVNLKQQVNTYARGNCDSIATVIFQAGAKRFVDENINSFVIHNAHINPALLGGSVDANMLKQIEKELRSQEDKITSFYTTKTPLDFKTLDSLMDKDSNLEAKDVVTLGFADSTFSDLKAAALVMRNESYNDYPKAATENAKRALKWLEENDNPNDCLTAVGFARANQLANRENLSRDTIARMAAFERHNDNKNVPYEEGCGGVAWDAWGGDEGIDWAKRKLEQIDNKNESTIMNKLEQSVKNIWSFLLKKTSNQFFMKLADGQEVYIDSEDGDFIGKEVYLVRDGEITSEAAPDGSHELATGKTLVIEGGKAVSLSGGMEEEGQAMEEEEIEETIEDSNNMTEEEMEEKMQAMFENGMKELENKLTAMFTKQGEALAENRKQLDDEYADLKTQMRGIVTNFSIPANAGNHKDGNHEDKVLTQATPENLRAFRERLRANKA